MPFQYLVSLLTEATLAIPSFRHHRPPTNRTVFCGCCLSDFSFLGPLANWSRIISLPGKLVLIYIFSSRIWGSDSHFAKINSMILKTNRNKKPHKSAADTLSRNITLLY